MQLENWAFPLTLKRVIEPPRCCLWVEGRKQNTRGINSASRRPFHSIRLRPELRKTSSRSRPKENAEPIAGSASKWPKAIKSKPTPLESSSPRLPDPRPQGYWQASQVGSSIEQSLGPGSIRRSLETTSIAASETAPPASLLTALSLPSNAVLFSTWVAPMVRR